MQKRQQEDDSIGKIFLHLRLWMHVERMNCIYPFIKNIIPSHVYIHSLVAVFHYPVIISFSSSRFHLIPHGGPSSFSSFSSNFQSS